MKIQTRDPQHLKNKYSPELRRLPELPEGSEEFLAIAAGLKRAGGFIRPILIDETEHVVDDHSRTLLRAALRWQLAEVPVKVVRSEDAPMLRLHSLLHHRHLSKSALAYLAVPDLDQAFELARAKMLKQIKEDSGVHSGDSLKTVDDLAADLGVCRRLLFEARNVRKAFEDKKKYTFNVVGGAADGAIEELTLREWFEPRLLRSFTGGEHEQNRPMGLGGIIAGITAVREGNKDKFNPKAKGQLYLFENKINVVDGWKYWTKLTPQDRQQHFKNFEDQLEFIPDEQRDHLAKYFEQLAKKCRQAQRDAGPHREAK